VIPGRHPPSAGHRQLARRRGRHGPAALPLPRPGSDNVTSFLFPSGEHLAITAQFWREDHLAAHPEHARMVFTAEITADELIGVLAGLVAALR
jgi:hypothetical protein